MITLIILLYLAGGVIHHSLFWRDIVHLREGDEVAFWITMAFCLAIWVLFPIMDVLDWLRVKLGGKHQC